MRKALLISNMYPTSKTPYYGVFVQKLEKGLADLGIQFEARSLIKGLERNSIVKVFKYLNFILSLYANLFFRNGYDLIYYHFVPIALTPLHIFKRKHPNVKVIVNFHGGYLIDPFGKPIEQPEKLRLVADLAVVPSSYMAQFLIDHYQWDSNKIFVSPSAGVDLQEFNPGSNVSQSFTHPLRIGYVSRVSEGKGWEVFVDALAILKKNEVNFQGVMIGGGTQHKLLHERLNKLNLQGDIKILGAVSHKELPNHLRELDLNVFSTELYESLGLVGIEAMACGVPIIGSDIGGLKSYISHATNGFLFEPGNAKALTEMILEYLRLPMEKRKSLSLQAIKTAQQYESQKVARELYDKLESLY